VAYNWLLLRRAVRQYGGLSEPARVFSVLAIDGG
jgi:hypothetical protein